MIGIIGDLHFREALRYADYVADRRESEVKKVLDTIVENLSDCAHIVFLGDNFDQKNNPNQVIRAFTEFIERFNGKEIYILAGNHEKTADGKSAIDYLREIKNPRWHIITNTVEAYDRMVFCPYIFKQEIGVDNYQEATKALMEKIPVGKFLFIHHAISDSLTVSGQSTNLFPEIVLPKAELEKRFERVIAGHIHKPQELGRTLISGCIFTNEVGDEDKYVFKLNEATNEIQWIPLPCRPIIQLKNPTLTEIQEGAPAYAVVKAVFTEKQSVPIEDFKEALKKFDAYILVEQYPSERKKVDMGGATMEFDIPTLLGLYAEQKKVDKVKLLSAWEEISL